MQFHRTTPCSLFKGSMNGVLVDVSIKKVDLKGAFLFLLISPSYSGQVLISAVLLSLTSARPSVTSAAAFPYRHKRVGDSKSKNGAKLNTV